MLSANFSGVVIRARHRERLQFIRARGDRRGSPENVYINYMDPGPVVHRRWFLLYASSSRHGLSTQV